MKILAIRGENIASLVGPFAVEFSQHPLVEQGLIAITGKTGSGKSTLLDCLCLALYEQVPRFDDQSRTIEVGQEQNDKLKANDVRNLVSRGQAYASVEVEFIGHDERRYLVRWQVRRARNQRSGRWQNSARELIDCDKNQPFSANKREFQNYVTECIGLDYQQFRRSVMLAQGDFAAFLQANEDQRSALLEQMTGTQLYSEISTQVYENYKQHHQQLNALKTQLEQTSLLDEVTQSNLYEQLNTRQQYLASLKQLEQQHEQLTRELVTLDETNGMVKKAKQQLLEHTTQQPSIDQLQVQLEQLKLAEPLRELLTSRQRCENDFQQEQTKRLELEQQMAEAQSQHVHLQTLCEEAKQDLANFERSAKARYSEVEQSREIEQQYYALQQQLTTEQKDWQAKQTYLQQCQNERDRIGVEIQRLNEQKQVKLNWLSDHQRQEQWVERESELEYLLNEFLQLEQTYQRYIKLKQQLEDNYARLPQLQAEQTNIEASLEELERQRAFSSYLTEQDESLRQEQERLSEALEAAKNRYDAWNKSQQFVQQFKRLEQNEMHYKKAIEQAQQLIEEHQHQLQDVTPRLEELKSQYENARQVAELSEYRAQLHTHQPCPLCGSEDHPYLHEQHDFNEASLLVTLAQRIDELQTLKERMLSEWRTATEQLPYLQAQLELIEQDKAPLWQLICEQSDDLKQPIELLFCDEQVTSAIHDSQADLLQLKTQWEHHQKKWHSLTEQRRAFQQVDEQYQVSQKQYHRLLMQIELHQQSEAQLLRQLEDFPQDPEQAFRAKSTQLDQLFVDVPWLSWVHQLGVQGILHQLSEKIRQYRQIQDDVEQTKVKMSQLEARQTQQYEQLIHAQQNEQAAHQRVKGMSQQLDGLTRQLKGLLDGLGVTLFIEKQDEQRQKLTHRVTELSEQVYQQAHHCTVIESRYHSLETRQMELSSQLQTLQQRWLDSLKASTLTQEQCEYLLDLDLDTIERMRQQVSDFTQIEVSLRTQLEQTEQREAHLLVDIEHLQHTFDEQLATLELSHAQEIKTAMAETDEQIYQLRSQLDQNEQAHQAYQGLEHAYQQKLEECSTWEQLNQLVGSASGAKFRTFAQQLTLDKLLFNANHQLQELAPRYQLQRIPGESLALQIIDQDMADEVRSLASLSGGETFLVSLSLALALSAISSQNLQIQSLFIDEGFGSLDPQSLDIVLSCLDKLQAKGRQITVISHVQTMVERMNATIQLHALGGGRSRLQTCIN